jgi:ABC-type nickel/cobalt efflux system permease component RcnA
MIPLPVILAEFVMALGAALALANGLALARARRDASDEGEQTAPPAKRVARGRAIVNLLIGLVVFAWGLATFLVRLAE